jgi:aspartyl-tRNA(Asn)/glutamyl-tRNA(Gln) amidotransferase subunit C
MSAQSHEASDLETVRRVASLARLALTEAETKAFAGQFARTLEHFQVLAKLDVDGVEATTGAPGLVDVTRPDVPRPSLAPDLVLDAAPERDGAFYAVPKTVGGDE